jgi:hypothetical protein
VADAHFKAYRIADLYGEGEVAPADAFVASGVSFDITDESAEEEPWAARATTLETYLLECAGRGASITADGEAATDATGAARMDGLLAGLYLVVGEPKTLADGSVATPAAAVVALPYIDAAGEWRYERSVDVKFVTEVHPRFDTVDLTAVKSWADDGHADARPGEITVALYCDGKEFGTAVLSAANNWRYTWRGLDSDSRWQLIERDVPDGYTMTSVLDGNVFVVTNTYDEPGSPENPVAPPSLISETPTTSTPVSDTPKSAEPAPEPAPDTLPQTGQLWWPVSALLLTGCAMFALGLTLAAKKRPR